MGRKQRRQAQIDAEVRARLHEFATVLDARLHAELDRNRQAQLALIEAVRNLRNDFVRRDIELVRTLDDVGGIVERATDRLDTDRAEREALVDVVGHLARTLADRRPAMPPAPRERERLIGGTFFGGRPTEHAGIATVDVDLSTLEHGASENGASDHGAADNGGAEPAPQRGWARS